MSWAAARLALRDRLAAAARPGDEAVRMEMPITRRVAAATIVEYSDRKQAANCYPHRIVSPSAPSRCCAVRMEQVGNEELEGGWPFVYMRCCQCGFTIRRFDSAESLFDRSIGETVGVGVDVVLDPELESNEVDKAPREAGLILVPPWRAPAAALP